MSQLNRKPLDLLHELTRHDLQTLTNAEWLGIRSRLDEAIREDAGLRSAHGEAMREMIDRLKVADDLATRLDDAKGALYAVNWEWLRELAVRDDTIAADVLRNLEAIADILGLTQVDTAAHITTVLEVQLHYTTTVEITRPRTSTLNEVREQAKDAALQKLEVDAEPNRYEVQPALEDIPF